jgi:gas vesicle protein
MSRNKNDNAKKFAVGALIAGVAGYVTGVLTAPKSGKQTREDIKDKAIDVKDTAEDQLQRAQDELDTLLKKAKTTSIALSAKAREEYDEAVIKAKDASNKAASILKGIKAGQANDPELNKAIKQLKLAQKNLAKYLKS